MSIVLLAACRQGGGDTVLLPVRSAGSYGFLNRQGKVSIPFRYAKAGCFSGGLAVVAAGVPRRWGYLDDNGRSAIPLRYTYATSFSEGLSFVVEEGGAPMAIDKNGIPQFHLYTAQSVENFSEGLAAFSKLGTTGEIWGFVDKSGNTAILPQYTATSYFTEGLCAVMNGNGSWGFINKQSELVIDYLYDNAYPFKEGMSKIMLRGKWGIIDSKGASIIPPIYNDVDVDGNIFLVKKARKWGWIDKDGKELIPIRFADAYPFNGNRLTAARLGEKWGYIDVYGKFVIPARYDFAFSFDGALALVETAGRYGFINENGEYVIQPIYEHVPVDYFIRHIAGATAYYGVKTDVNLPANVAYKWLTGFYHLDYFEANRYATGDTKMLLQQFAHMSDMISDSSKERMMGVMVGIKNCRQEDDRAIVTYTLSDNRSKEQLLFLVRDENNKWLVQLPRAGMTDDNE